MYVAPILRSPNDSLSQKGHRAGLRVTALNGPTAMLDADDCRRKRSRSDFPSRIQAGRPAESTGRIRGFNYDSPAEAVSEGGLEALREHLD